MDALVKASSVLIKKVFAFSEVLLQGPHEVQVASE